jgi:hypothetical protein
MSDYQNRNHFTETQRLNEEDRDRANLDNDFLFAQVSKVVKTDWDAMYQKALKEAKLRAKEEK